MSNLPDCFIEKNYFKDNLAGEVKHKLMHFSLENKKIQIPVTIKIQISENVMPSG